MASPLRPNTTLRIIGLTGGIACGKSTVSQYLHQHYFLPIFDADLMAREAVLPNTPILQALVNRYGGQLLKQDGQLNRPQLGKIIFSDANERRWVESQIHPFVRDRLQQVREYYRQRQPENINTIVMVIPLLFEARMEDLVTEIWVVTCGEHQQIERLIHRNQLSPAEAKKRIDSQMSLRFKEQNADVVLDNQTSQAFLYQQVDQALA